MIGVPVVMRFPGRRDTVGLVEHARSGAEFDVGNVGLDHLAFNVGSGEELDAWANWRAEHGVDCSGPVETPFGGMLHFKDPTGIALALFWER